MAKINFNTMSKTQLGDILVSNIGSIKNTAKNGKLKDRVLYAGKHDSTKSDLLALVKEVATSLGESLVVPAFADTKKESSNKPKLSMSKKGSTKSENLTKAQKPTSNKKADEKKETPKKESPKSEKPKAETPKKDAKKSASEVIASRNGVVLLEQFPDKVVFDKTTYVKATDLTTMKKLHDAVDEDRDIIIAFYFPKRNLKQFGYFNNIMGKFTEFKNDLDFCQPIYVSDEDKVAYLVSLYTEAFFFILPDDFKPIDGVKIAGSIEFEIYEAK